MHDVTAFCEVEKDCNSKTICHRAEMIPPLESGRKTTPENSLFKIVKGTGGVLIFRVSCCLNTIHVYLCPCLKWLVVGINLGTNEHYNVAPLLNTT